MSNNGFNNMVYPRYYQFLTGLALSRGTCNTTLIFWILYTTVHTLAVRPSSSSSDPTTNDVRSVVTVC